MFPKFKEKGCGQFTEWNVTKNMKIQLNDKLIPNTQLRKMNLKMEKIFQMMEIVIGKNAI